MRAEAASLAEIALRKGQCHLGCLAEMVAADKVDIRTASRPAWQVAEARFPRLERSAEFTADPGKPAPVD